MPSRVYVGNLPGFVRERDVEDLFSKFGRIRQLDLKTPQRGAPYAFLEFDDERDADEAVYRRNGYDVEGCRLRVEFSRGGRGGGRDGGRDGAGRGPPRRSEFRVVVSGLPRSASWQDLKDHMRRGGDIGYANTFGDGTGVVEYGSYEDMRNAIRKLDDSEFRNPWDKAFIRVREERGSDRRDGGGGRDRRRSRSRSPARRRRSRSGDRRRRSRSGDRRRRSRSRSPAKDESKADRSRSKSRGSAASGDKPKSRSRSGSRKASKSRSRSGSRKASKSRSRSGSRKASKSRSKSRSKSPAPAAKSASRSRSKSKSRSRSRSRS